MYREIKVKIINPIYAIGFAWLLYGLIFPLYRLTDLFIASGFSILCYLGAKRLIPERAVIQPLTEKGVLDIRCMEIIDKGYAYIEELERMNGRISDSVLTEQIIEITGISRQMLAYTVKNPRLALDLRNFIDYYFPVTLKLLNAYTDMHGQSVKSENVTGIMDKVRSVMGTIVPAFRKQLDLMYAEKRLDIKTDIEVLKNVLAAEGLAEGDGGAVR